MENLALEIFDLTGTGSQFASLPDDAVITITKTNEVFASGDVWSHSFVLNVFTNVHIFGTAGDMHGARLHEQVNKRRARLWAMGVPLNLGYLKLDDEAEVDADGNVDVSIESGQKTFEEMIEGTKAREVSVGDVVIGVALNRKRVVDFDTCAEFTVDGLAPYEAEDDRLRGISGCYFSYDERRVGYTNGKSPFAQRWPKMVKSHGTVLDSSGNEIPGGIDYTNIQTAYDDAHPFCNLNICYQKKVNDKGEEKAARGYTTRLAHGDPTTDGGNNQTRYNNAPNFYLLHFIDRLFKDLKINIEENQALDVEDLRRVFMLNYGCFYEEIEDVDTDSLEHKTPEDKLERYGQYYMPMMYDGDKKGLLSSWGRKCDAICVDDSVRGKILLRDLKVYRTDTQEELLSIGSVEGTALGYYEWFDFQKFSPSLVVYDVENETRSYSAYLAYATGENYPNVDISEVIEAMKQMFGVRFIFSDDYRRVRIVLLRNVFRDKDIQDIACEIVDDDEKIENNIRGFRMTYGKGTEDTNFYYKGFNDLFPRAAKTWKDTTDKHDYSQWDPNAEYDDVKRRSSAMNRTCYITPVNGNAYVTKVDEEESVLFPTLVEVAAFMDAEDGDCSKTDDEGKTVEEVKIGASPVIMNEIGNTYASLFGGEMKAPSPDNYDGEYDQKIATFGRATYDSYDYSGKGKTKEGLWFTITGKFDLYISEGFQIRMMDNYGIGNGGTPFDEADPGLQFGIMRSSGANAHVAYYPDEKENEDPENDWWETVPGEGAIDHPDTCDNYGNEWDYAIEPSRSFYADYLRQKGWNVSGGSYSLVQCTYHYIISTSDGDLDFLCTPIIQIPAGGRPDPSTDSVKTKAELEAYVSSLWNTYGWDFQEYDTWKHILLVKNVDGKTVYSDGRFSLKLRAEKLNPGFDPKQEESAANRRYLEITNGNLRGRGLCDQFYKEYSFFVRNARIAKRTVHMELAQLLTIDMTKRVRVGDITGFIRKMQYSVGKQTGLGMVTMEIMYI